MDGSNLAKIEAGESALPEYPVEQIPSFDDFDSPKLGNWYYAPRILPQTFADLKARPGYVRIRGQESRTSLNQVSILARKLTYVHARITTKMEFVPEVHQHSAGLILYYDNMNYINLRKYYSETLGQTAAFALSVFVAFVLVHVISYMLDAGQARQMTRDLLFWQAGQEE